MTFLNRISDGTKAAIVVVFFLMALVGFFAGSEVKRVVIPGPERDRIQVRTIPGPTVTVTGSPSATATRPTHAPTASPRPVAAPTSAPTVTRLVVRPAPAPGTVTASPRTVTRVTPGPTVTHTVTLPRATVTTAPVVVVQCFRVALLGLVRIDCPR